MRRPGKVYGLVAATAVAWAAGAALAQQAPVTRDEFDNMVKELNNLRQEVQQLRQEKAAAATQPGAATAPGSEVTQLRQEVAALKKQEADNAADAEDRAKEMDQLIKDVMAKARENALGQEKLLITGDADVGFTAQRHSPNTFSAGVAPRFLWKINDELEFDAAMDIGLDDTGTTFDLTIARVNYLLNDYLTVGAGLFVAPFGAYHRDFDPSWINKLPDDPLVFSDNGLGPSSILGAYISGAYPIGSMKVNYALYVSNGPSLVTSDTSATGEALGAAGSLNWSNNVDLNNNKAVGGRIGFLPVPELEVGYSILCGQAGPSDYGQNVNALLQAVDLNYVKQYDGLLGTVSLHTEWVFSHVQDATYTTGAGAVFLPNNNRNGGYVQLAYRPNLVSYKPLRNFEGVFRYDRLDGPGQVTGGGHEQRLTWGLNYWLDARSVLKFAYECDEVANGPGSPAWLFQFGLGF